MCAQAPRWAAGLHRVGLYFEGFVNDAPAVLEEYYKETVTSFGVRNSSSKCHSQLEDKENDETQDGRRVYNCTCRTNSLVPRPLPDFIL